MTIEELQARQSEIRTRLQQIDSEHSGRQLTEEARSEWNTLNEEHDANESQLSEMIARRDRVEELSGGSENRESGATFNVGSTGTRTEDIYDLSTIRSSVSGPEEATRELRDRAMRSIESSHFPHDDAERSEVQGHLERLVRTSETKDGQLSRHLLSTGSPTYMRAFSRALAGQPLTHDEQRALSLAGSEGGYAVPFQLDPTIIPTSNSSVNPYRAISRVESLVGTNTWKGVSSAGITASYADEAAEATDDAPTLGQPEVEAEKAHAFVPFSIEVGGDWGGLQAEMATLLQDAKDDLEAAKFTTGAGSGSDEPEGIITGATTVIETATQSTFATEDVYALEEGLPPRFRARAQFVGNRAIYNKVRQFDTSGGADLWMRLPQGLANNGPTPGNTGAELIGYSANEVSEMSGVVGDGNKILAFGDFRYFLIVERIGMTVELVQHLFGGNQRPTGQRGLYAYWRNSSKVLSASAFRVLAVNDGV